MVHQHQSLPNARKRLTRQVFDREGRRGGLLASQHCSQEPIAETTITVVAEAQGLGHASILPALPITVRKTNRCREQVRRYREPGEEGSSRPQRGGILLDPDGPFRGGCTPDKGA